MPYIGASQLLHQISPEEMEAINQLNDFKHTIETEYGSLAGEQFSKVNIRNAAGQTVFVTPHNPKRVIVRLQGVELIKCEADDTTFTQGDYTADGTTITLAQPIKDNSYVLTVDSKGLTGINTIEIKEQLPVGSSLLWFSTKPIPVGFKTMLGQLPATYSDCPELLALFPDGLPNTEHRFIRGAGPSRAVLTLESDAIRNITGAFGNLAYEGVGSADGSIPTTTGVFNRKKANEPDGFVIATYPSTTTGIPPATYQDGTYFDASRIVPTAAENRPINISAYYIVKAFSTLTGGGTRTVEAQLKQLQELAMSITASSVPAGITMLWSSNSPIPAGYLPLLGQLPSELTNYPALLKLHPNGLPNTQHQFIRGAGASRPVLTAEGDAIRNITGTIEGRTSITAGRLFGAAASGAMYSVGEYGEYVTSAPSAALPSDRLAVLGIDVSRVVPTANENRPTNLSMFYIIKAYDYAYMPEAADFTYVVQELKPKLESMVAQSFGVVGATRNSVIYVPTNTGVIATLKADEIVVENPLNGAHYRIKNINTTLDISKIGLGGMQSIAAPVNGYIGIYLIHNPVTKETGLIASDYTTASAPETAEFTLPEGFLASALLMVWRTSASKLVAGLSTDRQWYGVGTNVSTATAAWAAPTAVSLSGVIPRNAKAFSGWIGMSSPSAAMNILAVQGHPTLAIGNTISQFSAVTTNNHSFSEVPIINLQTTYVTKTSNVSISLFRMDVNGYRI